MIRLVLVLAQVQVQGQGPTLTQTASLLTAVLAPTFPNTTTPRPPTPSIAAVLNHPRVQRLHLHGMVTQIKLRLHLRQVRTDDLCVNLSLENGTALMDANEKVRVLWRTNVDIRLRPFLEAPTRQIRVRRQAQVEGSQQEVGVVQGVERPRKTGRRRTKK